MIPIVEMSFGGGIRRIAICEAARWPQGHVGSPPLTVRGRAAVALLGTITAYPTAEAFHDGSRKLMSALRASDEDADIILYVMPGAAGKVMDELVTKGARPWASGRRRADIYCVDHQRRRFLIVPFFGKRIAFSYYTLVPRADRHLLWQLALTSEARGEELEIVRLHGDMNIGRRVGKIIEQADSGAVIGLACPALDIRYWVIDAITGGDGGWLCEELEVSDDLPPALGLDEQTKADSPS